MDLHTLLILSCLLVAGNAHEKTSPAVSSNNFLNAFYAQWSRNEKDQLLNKYEITSLIFKETLQVFANMTERKEYSACFTNDVTRSASHGPHAMNLYSSEVQQILTTLDTQPVSNYMTCLLHHQTNITSTAFVAMAMCANIYGENGQAPVITSVTCIEKPTPPKIPEVFPWALHSGVACRNGIGATDGMILENIDLGTCLNSCKAVAGCEGVVRRKNDADGMGRCWHKHNIDLNVCGKNSKSYDLYKNKRDSEKSMPTSMMSPTTTATSRPISMTSPTTTAPSRATSMIFSTATAPLKHLLMFIALIILY